MIAQEHCLIHDENCIHYSERQDINCLRCLINEPYKDSIILIKDSLIIKHKTFIESSELVIKDLDFQLEEYKIDLVRMKKNRKNAYLIGGGTTLGAFLLTFFLLR